MLSVMIAALLSISSLRDAGARGEIADVTGRLSGEKIEIEFPGRRLGGVEAGAVPVAETAPEPAGATAKTGAPAGVPSGDSKLRLLKISALRGCARAGDIHRGDLLMVFSPEGEVLHSQRLCPLFGRTAAIPVPRPVSSLRISLFRFRWRKAAGVKVLREPSWLPFRYTKREVLIPMRDGVRLYTAIYEPCPVKKAQKCKTPQGLGVGGPSKSAENEAAPSSEAASAVGPRPIVLMRSPYPVGTYGYGGPGDLSDRIRCFTDCGYIIVEQNVRGTYMSEGVFEDVRPLVAAVPKPVAEPVEAVKAPTDEATDAYDTIEWLLANTRNNGSVGIYGVSYPGFYATCAAVCGHPALKIVSPQAPVTDWWMGDDAHHNGALMLCDMYGFGAGFFRPKGNPTPDSAESLSALPDDADLYTWFRGKPLADLLQPFLGKASAEADVKVHFEPKMAENELSPGAAVRLQGFVDMVEHPNYDEFWQERNPLRHLKNVRPAVMVVGGLYDAEDAWGPEHTLRALREQNPETEIYGVFGPWTHGGWRKDPDFLERIETPIFEYYLEGKGEKPSWRDLLIPTGSEDAAPEAGSTLEAAAGGAIGENLAPGKAFLTDPAASTPRSYPIAPGKYVSDPANPVPYLAGESHWRDKAYMWADQRFASERPDVLTQTLTGPLSEDLMAVGPVTVRLRFSVQPAKANPADADGPNPAATPDAASPADPASQLDLDLVVKLIDVAPDGTQTLVRGDVCPARWRNAFQAGSSPAASALASTAASTPASSSPGPAASIAPAPLTSGIPATLSFAMASIGHRFAAGHTIALQIQSSWFPLVAMNPQAFLANPYTATAKDYRPVEVSILPGSEISF